VSTVRLLHSRIELALHRLRDATGRPLLLLHGLGERTPEVAPSECLAWPGPIYGLDFCGHGASGVPRGGGYTAEALMGDADTALRHLGQATVVGRGLGAYVALLLAELSCDVRPPDYATAFLRQAIELSGLERPVSTCCAERPEWLAAVAGVPGALETQVDEALRYYAGVD
jgi:pimeloyl-ACP methyl ester carboxylesterase